MIDAFQLPVLDQPVAKFINLRQFHASIEKNDGKGHTPEKAFAHHPEKRGGILPHRPEHAQRSHTPVCLAENVNSTGFQPGERV